MDALSMMRVGLCCWVLSMLAACQLDVSVTGSGMVTAADGSIHCAQQCTIWYGAEPVAVELSAQPAAGYQFVTWAGACQGVAGACTVEISPAARPVHVEAIFEPISSPSTTLTIHAIGLRGSLTLQSRDMMTTLSGSGVHHWSLPLSGGDRYDISVISQPASQSCMIVNPEGLLEDGVAELPVYLSCADASPHSPNPNVTLVENWGESYTFKVSANPDQQCLWKIETEAGVSDVAMPGIPGPIYSDHELTMSTQVPLPLVHTDGYGYYDIVCMLGRTVTDSGGASEWQVEQEIHWSFIRVDAGPLEFSPVIRITHTNDIARYLSQYGESDILPTTLALVRADVTELQVLDYVQRIEGDLRIEGNVNLEALSFLPRLETVTGTLSIKQNPLLASLSGLGSLREIGSDFAIEENPMLTQLTGLTVLNHVGGTFNLNAGNQWITALDLDQLESVGVLNIQQISAAAWQSLAAVPLRRMDELRLSDASVSSLSPLRSVELIGSWLIDGVKALTSLEGMDALSSVGTLELKGEFGFSTFTGFGNALQLSELKITETLLDQVALSGVNELSGLTVSQNLRLSGVALGELTSIGYGMGISGNPRLEWVDLGELRRVGGTTWLLNNPRLSSLRGSGLLTLINGSLMLEAPQLTDWQGLRGLQTVGSELRLDSVPMLELPQIMAVGELLVLRTELTTLVGLISLQVTNSVYIQQNPALVTLQGLEGVSQIPGDLFVTGNAELTQLTGLESLTQIGRVMISSNTNLCNSVVNELLDSMVERPKDPEVDNRDC